MHKEALELLEEAHKRWIHYLVAKYSPKLSEDQVEQFVQLFMDEKISRPQRIETLIGKILDITTPDS